MDDAERAAEALARIRDGKPPLPEPLPTKETWRSVRDSTCILEGPFYHALILPLYNYNLIIGSGKVGWTYETVVALHAFWCFVCSSKSVGKTAFRGHCGGNDLRVPPERDDDAAPKPDLARREGDQAGK